MLFHDNLLLEIQHKKHPHFGGFVIEYWLNIMNQGNTDITLVKVTVNDRLLAAEADCLAPGAEIDCLICRTGSVQQREGQLPPYEGKVIWLDHSRNEQINSVAYSTDCL